MRSRWFNVLLLLCLLVGWLPQPVRALPEATSAVAPLAQAKPDIEVEPGLHVRLMAGQAAGYLIYFRERPDLSPAYAMEWIERGRFVAGALSQAAESSQADVRAYLEKQGVRYQSFWIENVILVESSNRAAFTGLLDFAEISALRQRRMMGLIEPQYVVAPAATQAIEPNITHVQADQAWNLGYTGKGLVVANVDTGVRYTHQTLATHYRGNESGTFNHNYNWWDPNGDYSTEPGDDHGHGSHTMGTMVGDDGGENRIGMAPGAEWMACRGCTTSGCPDTALLECGQFIAAPWDLNQDNPDPDMRPNVVNNSWGDCVQSYDPWYQGVVDAWQAAGIYPVFSNGNASNCSYPSPPGLNTVGNPARYGNVTGVGSTGRDDGQYADHSNWGPTDNPDTVNPTAGWEDLKPQVLAPGVDIRSSLNGSDTDYAKWSGTSMSAPHVAGLIALMWSAAPCLTGDYAATETIIENTATPIPYDDGSGNGERTPNYATGWGEINAREAVLTVAGYCGDSVIAGQVTDAATLAPLANVAVTIVSAAAPRKAFTDASGNYFMQVPAGAYTLQAARYGYQTKVIPNVVAAAGMTTTRDIALSPVSLYEVSGQVTDATTGWPLYAHMTISGEPVRPPAPNNSVWTDPVTGEYSVMLAEGITYTLKVQAWTDGYSEMTRTVGVLARDVTESFALQADLYACSAPGYTLRVTELFSDSFEAAVNGTFPAGGWAQVGVGDSPREDWRAPVSGIEPSATPRTGNRFASFTGYYDLGDARLWRSEGGLDFTGITSPRAEFWFFHSYMWQRCGDLQFQISTDAGVTWHDMGKPFAMQAVDGWRRHQFDLKAYAGIADVRLGVLGMSDGCNLHVDDVRVLDAVCESPPAGGLLVGNVYDENYPGVALNGASVTNANGAAVIAAATPGDAAVGDGFYTLFAPAGAQSFAAGWAMRHYMTDTAHLTMAAGAVAPHDFSLPAGLLQSGSVGIATTAPLGQRAMSQVSLSNMGHGPVAFKLFDMLEDFSPRLSVSGHGEWLSRAAEGVSMRTADGETRVAYPSAYRWTPDVPNAANVLIYADESYHPAPNTLLDQALQSLGIAYTAHYDGDFAAFASDLVRGGPWDLVVFQNSRYYFDRMAFPEMLAYVQNGGALAAETVLMSRVDTTDPLYGEMGVAYVDFYASEPIRWWDPSHRLFTVPDEVPEMFERNCPVGWNCGSYMTAKAGVATAMAGYADTPSSKKAALVLRNDGRTLFKGFNNISSLRDVDADGDGLLDDLELWRNMVYGLLHGWENEAAWLTETPSAGNVPALTNTYVTLSFDASAVDQPGEYHTTLLVRNDTPYGDWHIPVTMTVTPPASWGKITGAVTGLGVCDADPAPLSRATVQVESVATGKQWTLETDENGAYVLWLDQAQSPVTITVSAPDYSGEAGRVAVIAGQTTAADFDLRLLAPCLTFAPAGFAVTLDVGEEMTASLTLSNTGTVAAEYEFVELNGAFAPVARLHLPRRQPPLSTDHGPFSLGVAPLANPPASPPQFASPIARLAPQGTIAYASDAKAGEFVSLDLAAPEVINVIGQFSKDVWAGDFGPDGILYVIPAIADTRVPDKLFSVDPATGAQTLIGSVPTDPNTAIPMKATWTGMAWDPTSQTMYACATDGFESKLYVIDLNTPAAILVGQLTNALLPIALAVDDTGRLYTYDVYTDRLLRVDKSTGAGSVVGYIGFDANYGQGMDFDEASGRMLMAAINADTMRSELRAVDLDTGATALIAPIGSDQTQWGWLALPDMETIAWLAETPAAGVIAAGAASVVDMTFNTDTPGMQPGVHYGTLRVRSNAPNDAPNIPLTLTVSLPDSWGKVAGVVTGLGVCDADPAPLAQAMVRVESATSGAVWTFATDKSGAYQFWYDPAHNPVTVTLSSSDHGYFGETGGITVTQQQTTTLNFDLRLLKPCLTFEPAEVAVSVGRGVSATASLTLHNTGAGAAKYRLSEADLGSMAIPELQLSTSTHVPPVGSDFYPAGVPAISGIAPLAPPRSGSIAYGGTDGIVDDESLVSLDLTSPGILNVISPFTLDVSSAEFGPDGMIYAIGGFELISIDPTNGAQKIIAPISGLGWVQDMAFDPTTGIMYTASYSDGVSALYTLDLNTATATYVGRIADAFYLDALAVDDTGQMYAYICDRDTHYLSLLKVDKSTGASTVVGANIFMELAHGVAMDFDETSRQMFVMIFYRGAVLYTVDLATGSLNPAGRVGSVGSSLLSWFALPSAIEIPWLTATPVVGVAPADSSVVVTLNFDAGRPEITQVPGIYSGLLRLTSDALNGVAAIPVTMTVGYPPTWGGLEGLVNGPGSAGALTPLAGAKIFIEGGMGMTQTVTANARGAYKVWFDEKYSPVTVTISNRVCYGAQTFSDVAVTAGNVTTLDVNLAQMSACTFIHLPMIVRKTP